MTPEIETARELATHANDIKHLQDDMDSMKEDVAAIRKSIEEINKTLSEAKGGWKTLVVVGGIASSLGATVAWIANHFWR